MGELVFWWIGNAALASWTAWSFLSGAASAWHRAIAAALVGWAAWPLRLVLERWILLGTPVFAAPIPDLALPWPLRSSWLALLSVSALCLFLERRQRTTGA